MEPDGIQVKFYSERSVRNAFRDDFDHDAALEEFISVRNRLYDVLTMHGSVGPLGKGTTFREARGDYLDIKWDVPTASTYEFHLIDELWGMDKYVYLEIIEPSIFTERVCVSIIQALAATDGWGVCINNIPSGYLILFADRVLVNGLAFSGCSCLKSVVKQAVINLEKSRLA